MLKNKEIRSRKKEEEEELAPFRLCPFNGCRKPSGMSFKNLQHFTKLNNMMTSSRHVALCEQCHPIVREDAERGWRRKARCIK